MLTRIDGLRHVSAGLLLCMLTVVVLTLASPPVAPLASFPYPYDWSRFPAAWFGANATDFENTTQLDFIGKFSLAIFGWQHLIFATNWTASVYAQINQAAVLKTRHPQLPVYVYTGFGNADGYNAATWPIIKAASDGCPGHQPCRKIPEPYAGWFLQTDTVPVYSMSACEQMGLGYSNPPTDHCWNPIWNVANDSMRDYFIDRIIAPLAAAPTIDGVFFDCFNFAYDMPTPWNRRATNVANCTSAGGDGCEVLIEGTLDLARRVAVALNKGGKIAMFSNPASFNNTQHAPIWLNESRLIDALQGTQYQFNYEFMRAEQIASSGQLGNMLDESRQGIPAGVHTYLKNATEDPTPHLAAFAIFRQTNWYSFVSTGWLDGDWQWYGDLYDRLNNCGPPIDQNATSNSPGIYSRRYKSCTFHLDCATNPASCSASIDWTNSL